MDTRITPGHQETTMPRTAGHPFIETIQAYYQGCNDADVELMASTLTDDVVHYFVDHAPVHGAHGLASFWSKVGPRTRARWRLDHALVGGDEAVIEWTMRWTPVGTEREEVLRGTEWYRFRGGRIAEIRSYHVNWHLRDPGNFELRGFDYAGRGYDPDASGE
jgi:hypothetical protein